MMPILNTWNYYSNLLVNSFYDTIKSRLIPDSINTELFNRKHCIRLKDRELKHNETIMPELAQAKQSLIKELGAVKLECSAFTHVTI
jgi:hypothetical protein